MLSEQLRASDNTQFHSLLAGNDYADRVGIAGAKSVPDNPGGTIEHSRASGMAERTIARNPSATAWTFVG